MFVVSDTSCRFINGAITNERSYDSNCEMVIQNLLKDNYAFVVNEKTIEEQQIKLAELIIKHQAVRY